MDKSQFDKLSAQQKQDCLKAQRNIEHHDEIIRQATIETKKLIAASVNEDTQIMQAINSIEELDRICNTLAKRMHEWYGYYLPEFSIDDNELYIRRIVESSKEELIKAQDIDVTMGGDFRKQDLDAMLSFARQIADMYSERDNLVKYLESVMKEYCPNLLSLAGALIGAKLLEKAKSLKHLSQMPSSTIQLLGAEQALFRHLRNRKIRPPKHGFILSHPYVMQARRQDKGSAARTLAAKISIAVKVDYFKGEFIGDKLKDDLKAGERG